MRKFKVGDKVIILPNPIILLSVGKKAEVHYVEPEDYNGEMVYEIIVKNDDNSDRYFWMKENWISFDSDYIKNQIPKMTDDEIYDMLKPKMEKIGIDSNGTITAVTMNDYGTTFINHCMPIENVKRIVATVYRSGYGRGQKGRPFVIGKKKQSGHWVPCEHGEKLAPGTKLRRNSMKFGDGDYAIQKIPVGTEMEILDGEKDIRICVARNGIWVSFPGGNNGENEKTYKKFHDLTGYHVIYVGEFTEYFDKWVEE